MKPVFECRCRAKFSTQSELTEHVILQNPRWPRTSPEDLHRNKVWERDITPPSIKIVRDYRNCDLGYGSAIAGLIYLGHTEKDADDLLTALHPVVIFTLDSHDYYGPFVGNAAAHSFATKRFLRSYQVLEVSNV